MNRLLCLLLLCATLVVPCAAFSPPRDDDLPATVTGVLTKTETGGWLLTRGSGKNRASYIITAADGFESVYAALPAYDGGSVTLTGYEVSRASPWRITFAVTAVQAAAR